MRTIKFRAWIKTRKRMINVYHWHKGDDLDRIEVLERVVGKTTYTQAEYVLMQFTGLKDKNGKDIYEGDMCRFKTSQPPTNKIGEIDFNDSCFWFVGSMEIPLYGINERDIEIIGNIYENPELIK